MFYCGIDLSARESHLCVVDDDLSIHLQIKTPNVLPLISDLLLPFLPNLQICTVGFGQSAWPRKQAGEPLSQERIRPGGCCGSASLPGNPSLL